jgi:hypothetical protein
MTIASATAQTANVNFLRDRATHAATSGLVKCGRDNRQRRGAAAGLGPRERRKGSGASGGILLLRTDFDQALREEHKAAHLHPFRHNVADDLSPFVCRIQPEEKQSPADAGDSDKNEQRVFAQQLNRAIRIAATQPTTLCRSRLVKEFRSENDDERAAPVRYRVAAECAQMTLRIEVDVAQKPYDQEHPGNDAQ